MTPELADALIPLLARLQDFLRKNPELGRELAVLGRALAGWAEATLPPPVAPAVEGPPPQPVAEPAPAPVPAPAPEPVLVPVAPPVPVDVPRVAPAPVVPPAPPRPEPVRAPILAPPPVYRPPVNPLVIQHPSSMNGTVTPRSLPEIARRCRAKCEAARSLDRPPTPGRTGAVRFEWADELSDADLWMLDPAGYSGRPKARAHLADAFSAAADAAEMMRTWEGLPAAEGSRFASQVLHLAAEAQAVLYAAIADAGKLRPDPDQLELFITIKEEAARRQIFVNRYLKREDRADPASAGEVARRVADLTSSLRQYGESKRARQKLLSNLKYKANKLRADPEGAAAEWPRVLEILDELVAGGLPPSNVEVRDLLLPLYEKIPDDVPPNRNADLVFREIDRYLATRPAAELPDEEVPTAEVAEVANLLRGKEVVLIGGQVRPPQKAALIRAFNLGDLDWVETEEHESVTFFEARIARPGVAVVLLAIRWSSHSYGEVQEYCDRLGKLLVRLPGGYNPNQVAHQILAQVGHRLRGAC